MLIVSMPKAASTSLKTTLCLAHGLEAVPEGLWDLPISSEFCRFSRLWPAHMRELDSKTVQLLTCERKLARFHLIPSRHNQELLNDHKKVILLRSPIDVILSLRRSIKMGLRDTDLIDFRYHKGTEAGWLKRAENIGLLDDMNRFFDEWSKHDGNKLIIHYEDLISDSFDVIRQVEQYFGLDLSETTALRKDNFAKSYVHALKHKVLTHPMLQKLHFVKKIGL